MQKPISVALAEDHQIFREQLAIFLNGQANIEVEFTASNGQSLLDQLENRMVDVVILDLEMPIMDGRRALNRIRKIYHDTVRVIILSMHDAAIYMKKYIKAGANAYLNKGCCSDVLVEAIESVHSTGEYFSSAQSKEYFKLNEQDKKYDHSKLNGEPLTSREIQICRLICKGFTCPKIGEKLFLSHRTIENHKKNIFIKFGIGSCTEMMEKAILKGYYEIKM